MLKDSVYLGVYVIVVVEITLNRNDGSLVRWKITTNFNANCRIVTCGTKFYLGISMVMLELFMHAKWPENKRTKEQIATSLR